MYQSIPKPPIPPRAIPGHLTRVKLRTVGNLTQNEARPVAHLTFVSKRLSAVGSKRISQFFDSAGEPRSRVIALVDSSWVFLLLSFYIPGDLWRHCEGLGKEILMPYPINQRAHQFNLFWSMCGRFATKTSSRFLRICRIKVMPS